MTSRHSLVMVLLLFSGCCSSDDRIESARMLSSEAERLEEAWSIYRSATVPHPDLGPEALGKVPEVERKITDAIQALGEAADALAKREGADVD